MLLCFFYLIFLAIYFLLIIPEVPIWGGLEKQSGSFTTKNLRHTEIGVTIQDPLTSYGILSFSYSTPYSKFWKIGNSCMILRKVLSKISVHFHEDDFLGRKRRSFGTRRLGVNWHSAWMEN